MKIANQYYSLTRVLLMFVVASQLFTTGCTRRPLETEVGDLAKIPIHIDWSQSGLDVSKVHSVSIWFFPVDGSSSFEYRYDDNLTDMEALLPIGAYSIIIFNETIDFNWSSLQFIGSARFETFRVTARQDTFRGLSARAEQDDLRKSPDAIAVWSSDRFEVTSEMIHATSKGYNSSKLSSTQRIDATLNPLTKVVQIKAYVQNLTSALRCSGTLTGAVGEVMLSTGQGSVNDVSHTFIMNDRIHDTDNPANGYIHANFLIFNAANETKNILEIDFLLKDNTNSSADPFDVTKSVVPDKPIVNVDVGIDIEDDPEDHPIILPEVSVGNDVGVDDWHDQIIPLL